MGQGQPFQSVWAFACCNKKNLCKIKSYSLHSTIATLLLSFFVNVLFFHYSASVLLYLLLILKKHDICW